MKAFNTWAFKREHPSDIDLLTHRVTEAAFNRRAISFILYWGRGPRLNASEPESRCFSYLQGMFDRIGSVYAPGTEKQLIFTDTHALLNGFPAEDTAAYFRSVKDEAARFGFESCYLSELMLRHSPRVRARPIQPDGILMKNLIASAKRWYRGPGTETEGARRYLEQNSIEKAVLELEFPSSIFLTFNGSTLRPLFPDTMPIFYSYSLRKGCSIKPWFFLHEEEKAPDRHSGMQF